jgi:hypothetical protein
VLPVETRTRPLREKTSYRQRGLKKTIHLLQPLTLIQIPGVRTC